MKPSFFMYPSSIFLCTIDIYEMTIFCSIIIQDSFFMFYVQSSLLKRVWFRSSTPFTQETRYFICHIFCTISLLHLNIAAIHKKGHFLKLKCSNVLLQLYFRLRKWIVHVCVSLQPLCTHDRMCQTAVWRQVLTFTWSHSDIQILWMTCSVVSSVWFQSNERFYSVKP